MKIQLLCEQIKTIDGTFKKSANKAINIHVSMRNWLIGAYIKHYELHGADRAQYGEATVQTIADKLNSKGFSKRNLNIFRQFYLAYPHFGETIRKSMPLEIGQTLSAQLKAFPEIGQTLSAELNPSPKTQTLSTKSKIDLALPPEKLLNQLNFSHFSHLLPIEDPLKRLFYEVECIKGTWSVRELKRQITSLYYERSGMSKKPEHLSQLTQADVEKQEINVGIVKDVYSFEFLGLPEHLAVEELDLEGALLDHLSEFILELGNGFCLEARQKRILIGDEYFFVDLVLYHRVLKCHVLVELKVGSFSHENAGQLNAYLNYYRAEVMEEDDNPPVGLLLVTDKNNALVEYATAGMDENLFVKKYMLQLPKKEALLAFLKREMEIL
jgi:predicted nuclease of restriction endonuclease-like (RecB) superfamily